MKMFFLFSRISVLAVLHYFGDERLISRRKIYDENNLSLMSAKEDKQIKCIPVNVSILAKSCICTFVFNILYLVPCQHCIQRNAFDNCIDGFKHLST